MKTTATTIAALLALIGAAAEMHTVTFRRMNGTVLSRVQVAHGEPAPVPKAPDESGYTFKGWDNTNKVSSVTQDISCWALYEKGGFPNSMKGIDSQAIAAREQPYTLDEYFRLYDHVAWGDEFGEASLKKNFYTRRSYHAPCELCKDLEANRIVEDGLLKLRVQREDCGKFKFTSGEITTKGKVTFLKGRIEIRAKLNYGRGTWPSFWTFQERGSYNEIDVFEQLCGSDWIGGTLHVGWNGSVTSSNHTAPEDGVRFREGFHRIGAIVTERELVWYVDDHIFKRMDITESPWNRTQETAKCLLLCSGICAGGGWLDNLGPELKCATAADIPDDFMVDDYEIDYMRIYTNTNAGNTVAYDAPPAAAKLSAPVRATVWRGYDMRYGRTGQDFTANVNTGYEVGYYVNTALRQHFERDNADVVVFLSPTDDPDAELKSAFDIPGTSALFVDSKYRSDNGMKNEESRNGFVFNSARFDPAEAGAETCPVL